MLSTECILVYADSPYQDNRVTCCFRASLSQLPPQSLPQSRRCLKTKNSMVDDICVDDRILINVIMCLFLELGLGRSVRHYVCLGVALSSSPCSAFHLFGLQRKRGSFLLSLCPGGRREKVQ